MTEPADGKSVEGVAVTFTTPQVSVIIAAYNCAPYLAGAIESALGQSGLDLEVLVVDDASTDGTTEVARRYENTGRVRLLVNEVNRGPSYSRNRALLESRGDWVAQLDGDDWYAPGRLLSLLKQAAVSQADFIADDLFMVEDRTLQVVSTRFLDNGVPFKSPHFITLLDLIKYDLGSIKPLIRRSYLLEHSLAYDEDVNYGEDFLLLLKAMLCGARVMIVPEPMYCLRRGNTGSLTTQRSQLFHQLENTAKQLLSDVDINQYPDVTQALKRRIKKIQRLAMLEELKQLLKKRNIFRFIGKLMAEPSLISALFQRLPEVLGIRLRRRLSGKLLNQVHRPPCN